MEVSSARFDFSPYPSYSLKMEGGRQRDITCLCPPPWIDPVFLFCIHFVSTCGNWSAISNCFILMDISFSSIGDSQGSRVLETQKLTSASLRKLKDRNIPQAPERILDAPDYVNDYCKLACLHLQKQHQPDVVEKLRAVGDCTFCASLGKSTRMSLQHAMCFNYH